MQHVASVRICATNGVQDSKLSTARAHVEAITFGNRRSIYIILVLYTVISLLYAGSLLYIRTWPGVGKFNFTDVKSIIISASAGGSAIAENAENLHHPKGSQWVAAEDDKMVSCIQVYLCGTSASGPGEKAKVILAGEEFGERLKEFHNGPEPRKINRASTSTQATQHSTAY